MYTKRTIGLIAPSHLAISLSEERTDLVVMISYEKAAIHTQIQETVSHYRQQFSIPSEFNLFRDERFNSDVLLRDLKANCLSNISILPGMCETLPLHERMLVLSVLCSELQTHRENHAALQLVRRIVDLELRQTERYSYSPNYFEIVRHIGDLAIPILTDAFKCDRENAKPGIAGTNEYSLTRRGSHILVSLSRINEEGFNKAFELLANVRVADTDKQSYSMYSGNELNLLFASMFMEKLDLFYKKSLEILTEDKPTAAHWLAKSCVKEDNCLPRYLEGIRQELNVEHPYSPAQVKKSMLALDIVDEKFRPFTYQEDLTAPVVVAGEIVCKLLENSIAISSTPQPIVVSPQVSESPSTWTQRAWSFITNPLQIFSTRAADKPSDQDQQTSGRSLISHLNFLTSDLYLNALTNPADPKPEVFLNQVMPVIEKAVSAHPDASISSQVSRQISQALKQMLVSTEHFETYAKNWLNSGQRWQKVAMLEVLQGDFSSRVPKQGESDPNSIFPFSTMNTLKMMVYDQDEQVATDALRAYFSLYQHTETNADDFYRSLEEIISKLAENEVSDGRWAEVLDYAARDFELSQELSYFLLELFRESDSSSVRSAILRWHNEYLETNPNSALWPQSLSQLTRIKIDCHSGKLKLQHSQIDGVVKLEFASRQRSNSNS